MKEFCATYRYPDNANEAEEADHANDGKKQHPTEELKSRHKYERPVGPPLREHFRCARESIVMHHR